MKKHQRKHAKLSKRRILHELKRAQKRKRAEQADLYFGQPTKARGKEKKTKAGQRANDEHHLLFQRKHWNSGYWSKLLRDHPYMNKNMPQDQLHRLLHSKIHDVPVPNGKECKQAYYAIEHLREQHLIDMKHDTAEQRLGLLIDLWRGKCPATVAILEWQRDIIAKFYAEQPG